MFNRLGSDSVFRLETPYYSVVALCCILIWWKSLIVCHGCMVGIDVYRNGGAGKESDGLLWCGCQKPECLQLSDPSQAFSKQDEHDYIIMCVKWLWGASKWCIQELLFTVGNTEYTIQWPVQLHVLEITRIILRRLAQLQCVLLFPIILFSNTVHVWKHIIRAVKTWNVLLIATCSSISKGE